jgi:hypothetical protein
MYVHKFGTIGKKTVTIENEYITIEGMFSKRKIDINKVQKAFVTQPSISENGIVFLSQDGNYSENPILEAAGFMYTKTQINEVNKVLEILEVEVEKVVKSNVKVKKDNKPKIDKNTVICNKCGSPNVQFMQNNKKGFSVGKAVGGAVLTGGIGSLAGFAGKKGKKNTWHCLNCGNTFTSKK